MKLKGLHNPNKNDALAQLGERQTEAISPLLQTSVSNEKSGGTVFE
jgi:hypothetical protein